MEQGIFFTGSINSDDWIKSDYRQKLLDLFINPIDLSSNIVAKKFKNDLNAKKKKRSSHKKENPSH